MNAELSILVMTAFSVGFLHTILGSRSLRSVCGNVANQQMVGRKDVSITALCGLGHVLGSVVIGSIGLMLGAMLMQIEVLEVVSR